MTASKFDFPWSDHQKDYEILFHLYNKTMIRTISVMVTMILLGIDQTYSQIVEMEFMAMDTNCYFNKNIGHFIINNESELTELSNCKIPTFNFAEHTIIGLQGESPGHYSPNVNLRILKNESEKKIV